MSLPFALGIVTTACWAILAFVLSRFRPPRPLWPIVLWMSLAGFLWSAGELGSSFLARGPGEHWAWLIVLYTGVLAFGPLWWSLSLRFARTHGWSPRWVRWHVELAPFAIGLVCWLGLLTNPWLGWFIEPRWEGRNQYHLLWYVQTISSYLISLAVLVLFRWIRRRQKAPSRARAQLDTLSIAAAIPFVFNALYISRILSPAFDPTLLAFGLALAVLFAGMWRDQLLGVSDLTLEHWIDHEPDGVALVDPTGRLGRANEATARLLGLETLAPGASFFDVLRERLVETGDSLDDLFVGNELPEGYSFETRTTPRRSLRVRVSAIPRRWPGPGGFGLRFHDETRLRDAQAAAAQQAASIEAILGSIQDGLFVLDDKGSLLYANERFWEMWQIPKPINFLPEGETELFEGLSSKLANPETLAEARMRALVTGAIVEDIDLVSEDGRTVSLTSVPLVSETDLAGRVWTFRDITEGKRADENRRLMEERMRDSQKLESLGVLASGIAHDFNNILVGVLGNAELALSRAEPCSPLFDLVSGIKRSADRAAELVLQLLAYAGQGPVGIERFDLSSLVEETRELIGSAISKKAEVVVDLEPKVYVEGDSVQLRQIVMNMMTNASDALGFEPGTVTIRCGKKSIEGGELEDALSREEPRGGDYAFVSISDTGCGMDAATLSRIFEPFFSTKFAGRGLGLATALVIVRSHDGFIKVRSTPGRGTTFDLFLPVAAAPRRPALLEAGSEAAAPIALGGTVLVVDDEETVRSVAQSTLELQGYRVLIARDGQEGTEMFRQHAADVEVILLDMTMPRMDGAEALFAIRQISRDVPVVLTSGYSEKDTMERCAGLAAVAFIQKPFTAFELTSKIREAGRKRIEAGIRK